MPKNQYPREFVEGWDIMHVLGEGAFGEVLLLVNRISKEAVAMKVLDMNREGAAASIQKEVSIHKRLSNDNVIRFYGNRVEKNIQYIFLEYASGGELFDKIEPDVGMAHGDAQKFFRQLLSGVQYLHQKGIAHRDLKPENLLLDANDVLKISDFGMATLFRRDGQCRTLFSRCGTLPYIAPEVLNANYEAEPADLWSCGVILVALLGGELPWDQPCNECREYREWNDCKITNSPWSKMDNLALSLLRKILNPIANRRYTIVQMLNHQWMKKIFDETIPSERWSARTGTPMKRICSGLNYLPASERDDITRLACSQPEIDCNSQASYVQGSLINATSFSQPVQPEHMLLNSQPNGSQGSSQCVLQKLVKRMTRFFVTTNAETTTSNLQEAAEKLGYVFKRNSVGLITFSTTDRRNMQLVFKASLIEMQEKILVDFRLSKGDGLEFKRHFMKLRELLGASVIKGPITWPIAIATNEIP